MIRKQRSHARRVDTVLRPLFPNYLFVQANSHHYSHRRHHWHGRWWAYGVGSCWAYSDRYDEYYWTCGDDDDE